MSPYKQPTWVLCLEIPLYLDGHWRLHANLAEDIAYFVSLILHSARKYNLLPHSSLVLLWLFRIPLLLFWGTWNEQERQRGRAGDICISSFSPPHLYTLFSTRLGLDWILIVVICQELRFLCFGVSCDFSGQTCHLSFFAFRFFNLMTEDTTSAPASQGSRDD